MARSEQVAGAPQALYRIGGVLVALRDPEGILAPHLERLYAHARLADDGPAARDGAPLLALEVNTDCRRPTEPPDRPVLQMVLDRPLRGFLLHGGLWLSDGRNAAWVDYERPSARFDVATRDAAALYVLAHHVFPIALGELLRTRGRYALHAAAIARPTGSGILALGNSGAGKSTLCYRALALGLRVVADDGLVLYEDDRTMVASPLYRELCLDPSLLRTEDRALARPIEPSLTGPRHRIELPADAWAERCTIDDIWLLERAEGEPSSLRSASGAELLGELARQNRRLLLHKGLAEAHLAFLARLTSGARGWVARLGSDILTSERPLEELLSR